MVSPLGAKVNGKKRKMLIFDTDIIQRMLGLDISEILFSDDFEVINKEAIAEILSHMIISKYSPCMPWRIFLMIHDRMI